MIDITLLGTGGMMPLPNRQLTSLYLKYNGHAFLVDAGEGNQVAIRKAECGFKDIDVIFLTHFHADHTAGIPGLLLTIGNSGRTEDLTIVGPKDVKDIINGLRTICPILPYNIKFIELTKNIETYYMYGLTISCFKCDHDIDCYGYCFDLQRGGKFDPVAAKELNIPIQYWGKLQKGEIDSVEVDGKMISRDLIVGPARKGLRVTYVTDTRPIDNIKKFARGADIFICEGMYAENTPEEFERAIMHKHMHFLEAAKLAAESKPKAMILTHFSPKIVNPNYYEKDVTKIFPTTYIRDTFTHIYLDFEEE